MSDAHIAIRNMVRTFRQKMVWTSDYERFQRMEDWRDEIDNFLLKDTVRCDCEDFMLATTTWVYRGDVLAPDKYGFSIVLTEPGRAEGRKMDHARAWFEIDGIVFYADSYSEKGWYRKGDGPWYAKEVQYSVYDNPMKWIEA